MDATAAIYIEEYFERVYLREPPKTDNHQKVNTN
jgi:hypothetical protein